MRVYDCSKNIIEFRGKLSIFMASSRLEFGVAKRRNECNRWNIRLSISVVNRMKK